MSLDQPPQASPPVRSVDDLVEYLRRGETPSAERRCGVEQEKLGFLEQTGEPLPLRGEQSVERVLERLAARIGGTLLAEDGFPIGIQLDGASISLEPGAQLELSGAPASSVAAAAAEFWRHVTDVDEVSRPLGVAWLAVGYRPWGPRPAVPWLPRGRYREMRRALPGGLAHDMMQMTASVQASFDFADEGELAEMVSCASAISPVVAAMFANSPLVDGRPSGWASFRYHVWTDVDPARCGLLRFMYEPGFTYRQYVEWALDAPLLFVRRNGEYREAGGRTFRHLLRQGFEGQPATLQDFVDLLSTLFPEIRLKHVVELRGADAVDARTTLALPALWTALLYDVEARRAARALVTARFEELLAFQQDVARRALKAELGGASALDLGREVLRIAEDALTRRCRAGLGDDRPLLDPLLEILDSGRTGADRTLETFEETAGSRSALIELLRY